MTRIRAGSCARQLWQRQFRQSAVPVFIDVLDEVVQLNGQAVSATDHRAEHKLDCDEDHCVALRCRRQRDRNTGAGLPV